MRISARVPRVIASLLTIVLLLATVTFTAGWYQPAADPPAISEKTSNFLPSDTTAYFSFNLLPGYTQSTRLTYFLSFFKDAILTKIGGVSSWGAGYVNTTPWSSIVGPELALATYNVSGDPGIVFFVQVSSGQTSAAIQELVILAMNTVLGGASSPSYPGGGVTQIDRTVGGAIKTEYYTNTTVGVSPDRYVLGTIGNVSLSDFQTLNASVTSGAWTGGGGSLSSNLDFIDVRAKLPPARMGLGFMNGSDLQDNAIGLSGAVDPYITALEGLIPGFSMVDAGLSILSSSSFALIEPYIPPYAGMSVSGINNGLQADFYSPDGSFPFASRKCLLHGQLHAHAEEQDVDLDGERGPSPDARGRAFVAEFHVELNRDRDKAEHVDRAAAAHVARQLGLLAGDGKVYAGHNVNAATGYTDIEREIAAEFERAFDLPQSFLAGLEFDAKEAAPTENPDRQQEGILPLAEGETEIDGVANEG